MSDFFIIDGSSMLSTSYYGNLPKSILFEKDEEKRKEHYNEILHTSDGRYTNGIFTMFRTLISMYEKVKPEYVAFVFDTSRDTFRRTELGASFYKANRKATPEPLKEQFVAMENLLQKAGFQVLMSDMYEADDFAASLVKKFASDENTCYVITKDHDYFQLVSENTRMWRVVDKKKREAFIEKYSENLDRHFFDSLPTNVVEYTPQIVLEEEGVWPEQIVPMLAIQGDPGDGIPGCKGISSAAPILVKEYGSIERIYEVIEECGGDAKKEKELAGFFKELGIRQTPINKLKAGKEEVILSEKLAQMKDDIEITQELSDFSMSKVTKEALMEIFKEYELNSLLKSL